MPSLARSGAGRITAFAAALSLAGCAQGILETDASRVDGGGIDRTAPPDDVTHVDPVTVSDAPPPPDGPASVDAPAAPDAPAPLDAAPPPPDASLPPPCPAGQTRCGASCVTAATDPLNCGGCGTRCAAGQTCTSGACRVIDAGAPPPVDAGPTCAERMAGLRFSNAGPIPGMMCVSVNEPSDPDTWSDNYFCTATDIGLQWSYAGPIAGLRCTLVNEPSDPMAWDDNYLCVRTDAPVTFRWSYAGPIAGACCTSWNEPSDPDAWTDNYLCY